MADPNGIGRTTRDFALDADPSRVLTPKQVRAHLTERRQARTRAGKA